MIGTDETDALALRVEAAIARLDARLRDSERWRSLVAEWRECVRQFGSGSASARGALLGLLREAWGKCLFAVHDRRIGMWTIMDSSMRPLLCGEHVWHDTEISAQHYALESAP
jgi:hypothetical protein